MLVVAIEKLELCLKNKIFLIKKSVIQFKPLV